MANQVANQMAAQTVSAPQASAAANVVLQVSNLESWYGESHILHGVNFDVRGGEVVTLLGRNEIGRAHV